MYADLFNHKATQQHLQARIAEAQASHAEQHRMRQQLSQALNWLGQRLIVWGRHLQTQPHALELQSNERI
jgi:hypothetical protein